MGPAFYEQTTPSFDLGDLGEFQIKCEALHMYARKIGNSLQFFPCFFLGINRNLDIGQIMFGLNETHLYWEIIASLCGFAVRIWVQPAFEQKKGFRKKEIQFIPTKK